MKNTEFIEIIRTQVHLLHEPGPLSESVIRKIVAAGEDYAGSAAPGLFGVEVDSRQPVTEIIFKGERGDYLAKIQGIRLPLLEALPIVKSHAKTEA